MSVPPGILTFWKLLGSGLARIPIFLWCVRSAHTAFVAFGVRSVMKGALLPQESAVQGAALLFLACVCAKSG